jgi:hypothetical protein
LFVWVEESRDGRYIKTGFNVIALKNIDNPRDALAITVLTL